MTRRRYAWELLSTAAVLILASATVVAMVSLNMPS